MLAAMYRHGPPPSVESLEALMREDCKREQWQEYMADMTCKIATTLTRGQKLPHYSQMTQSGTSRTDTRTGQEIVDSIVARRRNRRRVEVKDTETI